MFLLQIFTNQQLYTFGHALVAIKALTKKHDNHQLEFERVKALFLSLSILDLLDMKELAFQHIKVEDVHKLIDETLSDKLGDIQSQQCAIQLALLINYDIKHLNLQQLQEITLQLITSTGAKQSLLPNSYTDARNLTSALVVIYLIFKKYHQNLSINTQIIEYTVKQVYDSIIGNITYANAYAMSKNSEEHGGGFLLNIAPFQLINKITEILNIKPNQQLQQQKEQIQHFNNHELTYKLVNRQNTLLGGRPNKPECLCYLLWTFGAAVITKNDRFYDLKKMQQNILKCQYKLPISKLQKLALNFTEVKPFEKCRSKQEYAKFLLQQYGGVYCGFVQAEEKPDLLHTFSALAAYQHISGVKMDFCCFIQEKYVETWE